MNINHHIILVFLQEADLRYLVENIWATQSSLSAWTDLYDLVLVRWDKDEEWSPWNCILLTKDEAQAHSRIDNLEAVSLLIIPQQIGTVIEEHIIEGKWGQISSYIKTVGLMGESKSDLSMHLEICVALVR